MPERYLASLCSALAIAIFLYLKSTILRTGSQRATLAVVVLVIGVVAVPGFGYPVFAPAIALYWIALTFVVCLVVGALWRRSSILRQPWAALDAIGAASFVAGAVYWLAAITLRRSQESPALTLLVALLTLAACIHLLHELDRANVLQRPPGLVFGETLLLTGLLPLCFGLHRMGVVSSLAILAGIFFVALRLRAYFRTTEERRILDKMSVEGDKLQPEYTEASLECPEPRLWSMFDPMTAEKETLDLLYALVRALKPRLAVETGTFSGISSTYIARAMKENGRGRLITCEMDPVVYANACERFRSEGLAPLIDCRLGSSLELQIDDEIDLLYCDSELSVREAEVRRFIHRVNPFGLILIHDAGSRFKVVREAALKMETEGLISVILISTPRGLVIAQRREGRK